MPQLSIIHNSLIPQCSFILWMVVLQLHFHPYGVPCIHWEEQHPVNISLSKVVHYLNVYLLLYTGLLGVWTGNAKGKTCAGIVVIFVKFVCNQQTLVQVSTALVLMARHSDFAVMNVLRSTQAHQNPMLMCSHLKNKKVVPWMSLVVTRSIYISTRMDS